MVLVAVFGFVAGFHEGYRELIYATVGNYRMGGQHLRAPDNIATLNPNNNTTVATNQDIKDAIQAVMTSKRFCKDICEEMELHPATQLESHESVAEEFSRVIS